MKDEPTGGVLLCLNLHFRYRFIEVGPSQALPEGVVDAEARAAQHLREIPGKSLEDAGQFP